MKPATAGVYLRISKEDQSTFSLSSQRAECERAAHQKGFRTAPEYIFCDDGGASGELDRIALTRLREAARSGVIHAIFVFDLDRLSRKVSHQLLLLEEFEKHGAPVEFVNGRVEDWPEGRALLVVKGVFSELEKIKIRERTARGSRERALSGRVNSTPPYGYRTNSDGRLEAHPERAEIVRRIFALMIEGRSSQEVAEFLNSGGIRAPKRETWIRGTVLQICSRRAYTGTLAWGKTRSAEPKRRRKPAPAGRDKRTSFVRRLNRNGSRCRFRR